MEGTPAQGLAKRNATFLQIDPGFQKKIAGEVEE
jgi:hypothetical protein